MVLPLYLAMSAADFSTMPFPLFPCAYMACHFSAYTEGISNVPEVLPEKSMLILNDRFPCGNHSPDLVAQQLCEAAKRLHCESVLLDFQRPREPDSELMVKMITERIPCPVAVTEAFAAGLSCPVFLSPAPLHMALEDYLSPWKDREIWLEAALCQEEMAVTGQGTEIHPIFPTEQLTGGYYDEDLRCHYRTTVTDREIQFTLFDTPESLEKKLEHAHSLGITRAVGLWQELGNPKTT